MVIGLAFSDTLVMFVFDDEVEAVSQVQPVRKRPIDSDDKQK